MRGACIYVMDSDSSNDCSTIMPILKVSNQLSSMKGSYWRYRFSIVVVGSLQSSKITPWTSAPANSDVRFRHF